MRIDWALLFSCLTLLLPAHSFSHHSFTAEYDSAKLTQFTATVTKVEWTNSRMRIYFFGIDAPTMVASWKFGLASCIVLRRLVWNLDSLKSGAKASAVGSLPEDGARMANARKVTPTDTRNL